MGERNDLPRIKPEKKPTFFNNDTAIGFVGGGIAGGVLRKVAGANPWTAAAAIGLEVGGAVIGGMRGKARLEREQTEGRVVKDPTFLNKGLVTGFALSSLVAVPVGIFLPPAALVIVAAGTIWGGVARHGAMKKDLNRAIAVRDAQETAQVAQSRAQQIQQGYKNTVTPEESAALNARQSQGARGESHVGGIEASRAAAAQGTNR